MNIYARVTQETDTFNPRPTSLDDFRRGVLHEGEDILTHIGAQQRVGGFMQELGDEGREGKLTAVIDACTNPGGRIIDEALEYFRDRLAAGVRGAGSGDTLFISLHGAFASASRDSADSYLLQAIRSAAGRAPFLVLMLDHHANVTREMMSHADLVIGHETQPHDPEGTARKAVRVRRRVKTEGIRPATAWRKIPMIAPQDRFLTTRPGAMRDWFDHARRWEADPRVLAVSPFPMQPWLDAEEGGWAVVVHTAGDQALAEKIADESAELAWSRRQEFWVSERVPPAEAVRVPGRRTAGLTVISDTGDAVLGGAPGDSTVLLREIVEQRIESRIFLPLVDPEGVDKAHRAGVGARLTMSVGAYVGREYYRPIEITGTVRKVSEGFESKALCSTVKVGRAALLEVFGARLVLLHAPSEAVVSPELYTGLGLDMEDADAVVVKTGSNWQGFARWQKRLVRADTAGITQSRLQDFSWKRLPRPIYPLDEISDWR